MGQIQEVLGRVEEVFREALARANTAAPKRRASRGFGEESGDEGRWAALQKLIRHHNAKWAFSSAKRAKMYEDLAAFQAAGIPPFEAIVAINDVQRRRGSPLEYMTSAWIETIESGGSIGDAMAPWVDPGEVTMIASGEKAGTLEESLREAAALTRERTEMISLAASKLVMPAILILALLGFVYYIAATIVPTAKSLLPDEFMPTFARGYFTFGEYAMNWGPWIILAVILLTLVIAVTLPLWTGTLRDRADRFFPWTLFRVMQSAFFLLTLSAMLRSGMAPMTSLVELKRYAKPWMRVHLERMIVGLTEGKKETEALDTGMLLRDMSDRLFVYSQLPEFPVVMSAMGRDAVADLKAKINTMTQTVAFMVMLLLAVFVLATVFALGETSFAISDMVEQQSRRI